MVWQMRDKWNFPHQPGLTPTCLLFRMGGGGGGGGGKEAALQESDSENHTVSIQSSNGYLFHKVYFTISKLLTVSVLCFETLLVWS